MSVRIVTDSVSDLPPQLAREQDIEVLPLYVVIGDETYRDGVDINADRFYALLEDLPALPTTSQPTVSDFQEVYHRLLDQGHEIVSIHVSARLSGTLNSATQARNSLTEAARIEIVDSQLAGGALALLAMRGAEWARGGFDHLEVAGRVRDSIPDHHCFVMVDTLKYLQKGGRIGRAQAMMGSALQFKPILTIRDGEAHPLDRPRTRRRAARRLVDIVRALAPVEWLHVSHTTGEEQAAAIRDELADLVAPDHVLESRFGPVLGTHLGPGAISVAVSRTDTPHPTA